MITEENKAKIQTILYDQLWNGKSLITAVKKVNKTEGLKVDRATIYRWLNKESEYYDPVFCDTFARTREIQGDYNADKIDDLSVKVEKKKLAPDIARVAMDGHKWAAAQKQPKKYGKKQYIEQKSEVKVSRQFYNLDCLTKKELEQYEVLTKKIMLANGEDPDADLKAN